jgi:hypothetical protein
VDETGLSSVDIIPPCLHARISPGGCTIRRLLAAVQRRGLFQIIRTN